MPDALVKIRAERQLLPTWIVEDMAYQGVRIRNVHRVWVWQCKPLAPGCRDLLDAMAERADETDDEGSLLYIYGGWQLVQACGLARSTVWGHLARLQRLGFVVKIGESRPYVSIDGVAIFGIPGRRGCLDLRRWPVKRIGVVEDDAGEIRRTVARPGAQFLLDSALPAACHNVTGYRTVAAESARISRTGCPNFPVYQSSCGSPVKSAEPHTMLGVSPPGNRKSARISRTMYGMVSKDLRVINTMARPENSGTSRPSLPNCEIADLEEFPRLIALFEAACAAGVVADCEADRLNFVAAARRALTTNGVRSPCALFAAIVNRGRWELITQEQEDAARRLLKERLHGEAPARKHSETRPMGKMELPYALAYDLASRIMQELMPGCDRIEIGGSVRRRKSVVGDIEIIAIPSRSESLFGEASDSLLDPILWNLQTAGRIRAVKKGDKYKQFELPQTPGLNLDLFLANADNWGLILAIRTGPAEFSKALVTPLRFGGRLASKHCVANGSLQRAADELALAGLEFSLGKWTPVPTPEEKDFLALAGGWVEPAERHAPARRAETRPAEGE